MLTKQLKRSLEHFASKGLQLESNWNVNQRQAFANAVDNKVTSEANAQWQSEMRKQHGSKPNK